MYYNNILAGIFYCNKYKEPVTSVKPEKYVLYADDDVDDKEWVLEASTTLGYPHSITFVESGRKVLAYLQDKKEEDYPSLIVLDMNMPEMDGRQTLQKIKASPQYSHIPVAIVSTSANRMDQDVCQRLGASLYLTKPFSQLEWKRVVEKLISYIRL